MTFARNEKKKKPEKIIRIQCNFYQKTVCVNTTTLEFNKKKI